MRPTITPLGQAIRTARSCLGLTIHQVAKQAGLADSSLSRIETGQDQQPGPLRLRRIAQVLGMDEYQLYTIAGIAPALPDPVTYFQIYYGVGEADARAMAAHLVNQYPHLVPAATYQHTHSLGASS